MTHPLDSTVAELRRLAGLTKNETVAAQLTACADAVDKHVADECAALLELHDGIVVECAKRAALIDEFKQLNGLPPEADLTLVLQCSNNNTKTLIDLEKTREAA